MRTTLDLPDPVFRQLKAQSALRGLKLKDLVTELIQAGLREAVAPVAPRPRSPLPVIRKPTGTIHPALSNRQLDSILADEETDDRP